ncbi:MAG: hypothetical protein JSS14_09685 [Proteobacteria bacterium]|nr:hypothetical protein [Pseudomonadota bacterium]
MQSFSFARTPGADPLGDTPRTAQTVAKLAFVVLAGWLLLPILTPVHVEGFSASIQSMAMHLVGDRLQNYDRIFPLNLELFATSRAGMMLAAASMYMVAPLSGEWPMRICMWLGFALLVGASTILVRTWTKTNTWIALAALLLMPGVAESAFFYNDNVLSAGLALAGLALVVTRGPQGPSGSGTTTALLAGLLFGAAVLARADAVLLGPAFLLAFIGWRRAPLRLFPALLAFGATAGLVLWLVPAWLGFTFFDMLKVAEQAVALWDRGSALRMVFRIYFFFIGLPAGLLLAAGAAYLVLRREYLGLAMPLVVMLAYNLAYAGKIWEVRQVLPLTPFLGMFIALGISWAWQVRGKRVLAGLAAAVALVLLLVPLGPANMTDGPRNMSGRLLSPFAWRAWQQRERANFDFLGELVDRQTADTLFITDNWSADRYLHLVLQERGFRPMADRAIPQKCAALLESTGRDALTMRHLRLHTPILKEWRLLLPPRFDAYRAECGELLAARVVYVSDAYRMQAVEPGLPTAIDYPPEMALGRLQKHASVPLAANPLSPAQTSALRAVFANEAEDTRRGLLASGQTSFQARVDQGQRALAGSLHLH